MLILGAFHAHADLDLAARCDPGANIPASTSKPVAAADVAIVVFWGKKKIVIKAVRLAADRVTNFLYVFVRRKVPEEIRQAVFCSCEYLTLRATSYMSLTKIN